MNPPGQSIIDALNAATLHIYMTGPHLVGWHRYTR